MEERSTSSDHHQRCLRGRNVSLALTTEEAVEGVEDEEVAEIVATSTRTAVATTIEGTATSNKATRPSRCSKTLRTIRPTSNTQAAISSNLITTTDGEVEDGAALVFKVAGISATPIRATSKPSTNEAEGDDKMFLHHKVHTKFCMNFTIFNKNEFASSVRADHT